MPLVCRSRALWILLTCLLLLIAGASQGRAAQRIAVLYPDVQEPFLSVFQTIIRGIESSPQVRTFPFALSQNFETYNFNEWLDEEQIDAVIVLGRQGATAARLLSDKRPVVVGALPLAPDGFSGISLSPDPDVLFQHLRDMVPRVKTIHVVYSNGNAWLMPLAEKAAAARGFKLMRYPVEDLREAAREYRNLLQKLRGPSDAVWLPLDSVTADDDVVLPLVLQGSLERGLVVFSSKPSHVQRGVLFSLFPDHFAMGQGLAQMSVASAAKNFPPQVVPLAHVQIAVNMRTAFYLGLRFTPRQQEKFDMTFPPR